MQKLDYSIWCILVGASTLVIGSGCKQAPTQVQPQKPDLIITSASSQGPSNSGSYKITARIANIGQSEVSQPFLMFSSVDHSDYLRREVSYGQRVNDPPSTIPIGGALNVQFTLAPYDTVTYAFIVVNADSQYNWKLKSTMVDESNYDNNWYDLKIR